MVYSSVPRVISAISPPAWAHSRLALAAVVVVVLLLCGLSGATDSAQAAPRCGKGAAKKAVTQTSVARRIKHQLPSLYFSRNQTVLQVFRVARVHCYDLTDDGQQEMIVEMSCCTVSSYDPWAIFKARGGKWSLRFSRVKTANFGLRAALFDSDVEGGSSRSAVEEKIPVYANLDSNCCPSSFRFRYTVWTGKRFSYGVRW